MYVTCNGPGPHDPVTGVLGTGLVTGAWCGACVDRLKNPTGTPQPTNAEIMDEVRKQGAALDDLIISLLMSSMMLDPDFLEM